MLFRSVLRSEIDAPCYAARYFDPRGPQDLYFPIAAAPYLKLAAVDNGGTLTLFALNRHLSEAMPVDIHAKEFDAASAELALTLHDRDLKAVNTKEQPGRVMPKLLADVKASGERIQATLPPASWNVLRVALKKR